MRKFIQSLFVSLAFASCAENTTTEPDIPDEPTVRQQMTLSGSIDQMNTRVDSSGFVNGDKIGVFVTTSNTLISASGNKLDNALYIYEASSTKFKALSDEDEIYWDSNNATLSVFAYYPYRTPLSSVADLPISVSEDQTSAANFYASDFLAAQAKGVNKNSPNVNLHFKHLLSRINVTVKRGSDFTDEQWGKAKSFQISGTATNATVDLSTGVVTTGATAKSVSMMSGSDVNGNTTFSAILIPQSGQEGVVFQFAIDGVNYSYKPNTFTCAANVQYNYSFVINATDKPLMTLVGATIDGWGETIVEDEITMNRGN